ncbi:MAG: O-methyltransferase [Sphingobacteriia bacterium]|jgi:caffeoyl-CoA O-methyltransferase|nr:O-methyltransferase [Paludibacteraceae bacterium]NCA78728.1 O-methyltransferase [Sphingobacteriia bacterium]
MLSTDKIEEYICAHSDSEPEFLQQLDRATHIFTINPRMESGHLQGRILKMICRMIRPKTVLELGTFTGYSALCMAEALPDDGILHTIEVNDELEDFIRKYFNQSQYADKLRLHIGEALEVIPTINAEFDLVFIDADKRYYVDYFEMLLPKVRKGGFILADNTLWSGKVLETPASNDWQTKGILKFNDYIASDTRIEKVILPLRDGVTVIMKK